MVNDNSGGKNNSDDSKTIRLSLRPNINQFLILVLANAFVGAMVGLEQTVVPLIGKDTFHIESNTLILSFIASFGIVKAILNLVAGNLSDRWSRKKVLILGWIFGLPVPFILLYAPNWNWIIFANVLLGINQGLAWSMTVNMKVDLVGKKNRGLALGFNEFAGYISVAIVGFVTTINLLLPRSLPVFTLPVVIAYTFRRYFSATALILLAKVSALSFC